VKLVGSAELSWDLPAPVVIVDAAGSFPLIEWTPGPAADNGVEVVGYEVIAEAETEVDGKENVFTQVTQVTANVTSITTSPEFAQLVEGLAEEGILTEFKVEVIAKGQNGNATITEEIIFEAE
jgi:hypothetical protein